MDYSKRGKNPFVLLANSAKKLSVPILPPFPISDFRMILCAIPSTIAKIKKKIINNRTNIFPINS